MPHYSDGPEAKIADFVIGKPSGYLCQVIGVVVEITPNTDTCNLRVRPYFQVLERDSETKLVLPVHSSEPYYGTTKDFRKLL